MAKTEWRNSVWKFQHHGEQYKKKIGQKASASSRLRCCNISLWKRSRSRSHTYFTCILILGHNSWISHTYFSILRKYGLLCGGALINVIYAALGWVLRLSPRPSHCSCLPGCHHYSNDLPVHDSHVRNHQTSWLCLILSSTLVRIHMHQRKHKINWWFFFSFLFFTKTICDKRV